MSGDDAIFAGLKRLSLVFQAKQHERGNRCSAETALRGISLGFRIARLHPELLKQLGPVVNRYPMDEAIDAVFGPFRE